MLRLTETAYAIAVLRLSQWRRGLHVVQIRDRTSGVVFAACAHSSCRSRRLGTSEIA